MHFIPVSAIKAILPSNQLTGRKGKFKIALSSPQEVRTQWLSSNQWESYIT
jgi:hypothetical protein